MKILGILLIVFVGVCCCCTKPWPWPLARCSSTKELTTTPWFSAVAKSAKLSLILVQVGPQWSLPPQGSQLGYIADQVSGHHVHGGPLTVPAGYRLVLDSDPWLKSPWARTFCGKSLDWASSLQTAWACLAGRLWRSGHAWLKDCVLPSPEKKDPTETIPRFPEM